MNKSNYTPLLILGAAAVLLSRAVFFFIDDPEGPNLLVVTVLGAIVLGLTLLVLRFVAPSATTATGKRIALGLLTEIVLLAGFYIFFG